MIERASSVVERIRGAVLAGGGASDALRELGEAHASLVREANDLLARCHRWVQRGSSCEAVALGNAVHLARNAATLRLDGTHDAWARLLKAAGLDAPPEIDVALLESFVAAAGRQESMAAELAAMRHAALRRAPLPERLQTLRALADRDPRQPAWLEGVRRLEREACVALADAAREAERAGDGALAAEVIAQVDALSRPSEEHRELFERVRRMVEADRLVQRRREAQACVDRLHAAAAAMDMHALGGEVQTWQRLAAEGDLGESLAREAAGPLDLHRRHVELRQRERERADAIARLELALDAAREPEELERLAQSATSLDAALPADLARRLQERRAAHAATVARRRALRGAIALVVITALSVAGWALFQRWSREARLEAAIAELDRLAVAGELDSAERLVQSVAADPDTVSRPEWAAATQRLEGARARSADAERSALAMVAALEHMAQQGAEPVVMEAKVREATALVDAMPRARQAEARAAIVRLQSAAAAARDRALDASRSSLHALEARLGEVPEPTPRDAARADAKTLVATAATLDAIARDARAAATVTAAQRDGQSTAEAMQAVAARAQQRADAIRQRVQRIDRVREALAKLEKPQSDEQATLDLWEAVLRDGGDLLAERGMLRNCESARDAARAGVAIRAWRTGVVPGALAGRGGTQQGLEQLDWGDMTTAGTLEKLLADHLARHADTPYRAVAESLLGASQRTLKGCGGDTSVGAAAASAIRALGYAGLLEQPFEGGRTLYRRGGKPGSRWADAIESKRDLSKPPDALTERKPPGWRETAGVKPWPASAAVEDALAALEKADGRQARDALLRLLRQMRDPRGGDEVLQWHATRDLWNVWLRIFADERDPVDAAAAKWVRGLDGVGALLGTDPILFGQQAPGASKDALRRQAIAQLGESFDAGRLLEAAARRDASIALGVRPLAPAALMLPQDERTAQVAGLPNGQKGFVPARRAGAWSLAPLRVEDAQVVWMDAPPDPPVTWPQTIFIEGGTP